MQLPGVSSSAAHNYRVKACRLKASWLLLVELSIGFQQTSISAVDSAVHSQSASQWEQRTATAINKLNTSNIQHITAKRATGLLQSVRQLAPQNIGHILENLIIYPSGVSNFSNLGANG
jgi:hypothetical protein